MAGFLAAKSESCDTASSYRPCCNSLRASAKSLSVRADCDGAPGAWGGTAGVWAQIIRRLAHRKTAIQPGDLIEILRTGRFIVRTKPRIELAEIRTQRRKSNPLRLGVESQKKRRESKTPSLKPSQFYSRSRSGWQTAVASWLSHSPGP